MLGLGDISILAAMVGSIVAALVCVIYGAVNWNRGSGEEDTEPVSAGEKETEGKR